MSSCVVVEDTMVDSGEGVTSIVTGFNAPVKESPSFSVVIALRFRFMVPLKFSEVTIWVVANFDASTIQTLLTPSPPTYVAPTTENLGSSPVRTSVKVSEPSVSVSPILSITLESAIVFPAPSTIASVVVKSFTSSIAGSATPFTITDIGRDTASETLVKIFI